MTPELQVQGHWWLPGSDHKAPGWLTWNVDGGGTMKLAGRLEPDRHEVIVRANGSVQRYLSSGSREPGRKYPVIHGMVDGRCYTLLNSFCTSVQRHPLNE
ncbi:MAG TPA: hypothetical protein VL068_00830, partial [Microthrixaceae bacterium]|nr:hypothetical protein [Microthrixaceae bacterium]